MARNDVLFKGKVRGYDQVYDSVKLRVAWWAKVKGLSINISIMDLKRMLNMAIVPPKLKVAKVVESWYSPLRGRVKFNMDGALRSNSKEARIRGILRDKASRVLIRFSLLVGSMNVNMVEILAIRKALQIMATTRWANSNSVIVESNFKNAVKWVKELSTAPWKMKSILMQKEVYKI